MIQKANKAKARQNDELSPNNLLKILDQSESGLAVFDRDLRLVFANQKFHIIHQYEPGGLRIGTRLDDIIRRIWKLISNQEPGNVLDEMIAHAKKPDGKARDKQTIEGRHFRYRYLALEDQQVAFSIQNITASEINRRRHTEKTEQIQLILQEMAEGVNILDANNCLVLANQGFMEMYDFPTELNQPGTPITAFARSRLERAGQVENEKLEAAADERVSSIIASTDQTETMVVEKLPDGRTIEVRRRRTPTGFLISTYVDITDRLVTKQALYLSEQRYKAIIEDQTEIISRVDPDFNVTFANAAYKRTFLKDPENQNVIGLNIMSLIPDEKTREHYRENMRRLTIDNPIIKSEMLEVVADGTMQWQAWTDRALFDDKGILIGYQSVGRDITDTKIAQDALAANARERQAIVDGAIDAIVSIDASGNIRDFNPAAEQIFGFKASEALGRPVHELIVPLDQRDAHLNGLEHYLAGKRNSKLIGERVQLKALNKDGNLFPIELALVDATIDGPNFFVAYVRDLTETKRVETELSNQRQAMAQSEKMSALGSLLANVAHELNNPLSVVIGQTDLLKELSSDGKTIQRAEKIKAAAGRCARIVKTFLAMAREKPQEKSIFPAYQPITEALELVEYGLKTSAIDVELDIAKNLPLLDGDPTQIGQILTNLLINAQQALHERPLPRKINYSANFDASKNLLTITVTDSGAGVSKELSSQIFEPFFTTKKDSMGTGIGLAIAHNIATAHGGDLLLIAGRENTGASFQLSLPASDKNNTDMLEPEKTKITTSLDRLKILVVDDEIDVAMTVADYLTLSGYHCEVTDSAKSALEKLLEKNFEVVLSDLRMPEMDGPLFFEKAAQLVPGIESRFGFFTGDSLSLGAGEFLTTNDVPHIEKPFTRLTLQSLVKKICAKAEPVTD